MIETKAPNAMIGHLRACAQESEIHEAAREDTIVKMFICRVKIYE